MHATFRRHDHQPTVRRRRRWIATASAAVAAGGLAYGSAAAISEQEVLPDGPALAPITPCRLADSRPDGIGPGAVAEFDGWGEVGECSIPPGAAALLLNVTAVGATEPTNLRFFIAGADVPTTANLNPKPGATASNSVTVGLSEIDGRFAVFNRFGEVDVIIDVMGYYMSHHHDSRYYTKEQVDDRLDSSESDAIAHFAHDYLLVSRRHVEADWAAGDHRTAVLSCPEGFVSMSGGASTRTEGLAISSSAPSPLRTSRPSGWFIWYRNLSGDTIDRAEFEMYVICLQVPDLTPE